MKSLHTVIMKKKLLTVLSIITLGSAITLSACSKNNDEKKVMPKTEPEYNQPDVGKDGDNDCPHCREWKRDKDFFPRLRHEPRFMPEFRFLQPKYRPIMPNFDTEKDTEEENQ